MAKWFNSRNEFNEKYNYRNSDSLDRVCFKCVHSFDIGSLKSSYHYHFLNLKLIRGTRVRGGAVCDLFE